MIVLNQEPDDKQTLTRKPSKIIKATRHSLKSYLVLQSIEICPILQHQETGSISFQSPKVTIAQLQPQQRTNMDQSANA